MKAHLYDDYGTRLYFNEEERKAFIETANKAEDQKTRTFCSLLHYTGCNFTEALNFTPPQVDFTNRVIVFSGLLPHLAHIRRAIPVPDSFLELLDEGSWRPPRSMRVADHGTALAPKQKDHAREGKQGHRRRRDFRRAARLAERHPARLCRSGHPQPRPDHPVAEMDGAFLHGIHRSIRGAVAPARPGTARRRTDRRGAHVVKMEYLVMCNGGSVSWFL